MKILLWIFRWIEKLAAKSSYIFYKNSLMELQAILTSNDNPAKVVDAARIKVARDLISINKILDRLK